MAGPVEKREVLIPIRTILIVSAAIGVLGAFVAIGDTFLIVFVGIFLGLVFEFPVRFVIKRTGWSRGLAATVTVLGTAVGVVLLGLLFLVPMVGPGLPARAAADGRPAAHVERVVLARRHRDREECRGGREQDRRLGSGRG